ncbi:MAG: CapA family protein [Clostridiales bacterium]|nr:CapA family protein [Clostridiales bacterium]
MRRCMFLLVLLALMTGLGGAVAKGTQIVLTFTGDCTLGSEEHLRDRPYSFDSFIAQHGYGYPFDKVLPILQQDDVTVINFEGVLSDSARGRVKKTYNFRGPPDFVNILKAGSIELSYLGNNHTGDYGQRGYDSTIQIFEQAGHNWFATTEYGGKTWVFEKNGVKVGFAGCYISYWVKNPQAVKQSFEQLQAQGCDFIVGVMHGGAEYSSQHDRYQQRLARFMVDNGAGLVVGHHPHVLHGVEIMDSATVVYSLGNFAFGGNKDLRSTQTMLAQFTLSFDREGRYMGQQLNLLPAHPSGTLTHNNYQPILVSGQRADSIIDLVRRISPMEIQDYQEGIGAVQAFVPAAAPPLIKRDPAPVAP